MHRKPFPQGPPLGAGPTLPYLVFMPRSAPAPGVADVSGAFAHDFDASPMLWTPHRPARPEKSEGGRRFELVSDYQPAGDQPAAIADLVAAAQEGERDRRAHV